jgi:inosine-uridine nucleoside N-ribohydrolase
MSLDADFPLLLDVDTGVDDALALALAVCSPEARLVGVSTLAGNVPVDLATENTRRVLSWCGADDVPVFRGASRPLIAGYKSATHVHGGNGLGGAELPAARRKVEQLPGPGALIRLAEEHAGELVVVALGPLTNLAIALNVRPELPHLIRRLVVMGGAYEVAGNVTPAAEFNIFVDPHAANHVFAAAWRSIVAVGLDVTHETALGRQTWAAIPDDATDTAGLVRRILAHTFMKRRMTGMYLHDPLAVAVALDSSFVDISEANRVVVETDGEERGRTRAQPGGCVEVARSVRAGEFTRWFAERLGLPAGDLSGALRRAD